MSVSHHAQSVVARTDTDPRKTYTPATVIVDSAVVFEDRVRDQTWKPKNYRETFYGPTLLREALAQSRNVVTVKILQDIGIDYAIDYARKLGISSELTRTLSLALGASGVSLFELVRAYSVFANQGFMVEPVFTLKIVDRYGNELEEAVSERMPVIEKDTAFIMTSLMESVVQQGTGQRIKALGRPTAGKTGTSGLRCVHQAQRIRSADLGSVRDLFARCFNWRSGYLPAPRPPDDRDLDRAPAGDDRAGLLRHVLRHHSRGPAGDHLGLPAQLRRRRGHHDRRQYRRFDASLCAGIAVIFYVRGYLKRHSPVAAAFWPPLGGD